MSNFTQKDLLRKLIQTREQVAVGAEYKHYKGNLYVVLNVALLEVSTEPCIVYQAEYGERLIWARPVSDWLKEVEWQGKVVPRFTKV